MGFKIDYKDKNSDNLALFLADIQNGCEKTETKVLEIMKVKAKKIVIAELRKIKRHSQISPKRLKHMCEDVKSSIKKDSFGYKGLKVNGGKKTGTLWHIVNNGTYRTQGTHFMDRAMESINIETENVVDSVMKEEFKND